MARDFYVGGGIPSGLYSGGAVVFNSQPYTNYYLNQQAHRQAQEDAMYKYFGELGKSLTPSGMHTKDIPDLMQKKNEWQNFMMQNRKNIARPGLDHGMAYSQSMGMYNDMLSLINQSKNDVKNLASLKPILDSPQKKALLNDATMLRIKHGSLPINHPDYEPFDPTAIDYNPPQFGDKEKGVIQRRLMQYQPTDNVTYTNLPNHQQQVTHTYKFNDNDLVGMYGNAVSEYHSNPSFRNFIDEQTSPEEYSVNNQIFKYHYGRDINSREDMAAANFLMLHPDSKTKVETRNIPYSPYETAAAGLGREEQYYQFREGEKEKEQGVLDNEAEKFLQGREAEGKKKGSYPYTHAETGKKEAAYDIGFTPDQVKKVFSTRDISGKHIKTPDKIQVLESGDYLPIYYARDENGKALEGPNGVAVDGRYTKPVSREAVKASLISNKIVGKPAAVAHPKPAQTTVKKITFGAGGLN